MSSQVGRTKRAREKKRVRTKRGGDDEPVRVQAAMPPRGRTTRTAFVRSHAFDRLFFTRPWPAARPSLRRSMRYLTRQIVSYPHHRRLRRQKRYAPPCLFLASSSPFERALTVPHGLAGFYHRPT
uniref:Uncharacterized protein n=1 Tax=Plectus sambesii TaxID=2011161 RepID=A0A914WDH3_9BILA